MKSADQIRRLQEVFDAAMERPQSERRKVVEDRLADQPALIDQALRMLACEEEDDSVLDQPALSSDIEQAMQSLGLEARLVGSKVGRYVLREEIGSGGMGRVFRAARVDGEVEQQVAVKIVREEAVVPALLKRFSTERQALADLVHPNICRFIDAGITDGGLPYVVMELVEGAPITQFCDQRRLTLVQRLALFRQVVDAVAFAHSNLVLHRDIKPNNVLVGLDGQVKLIDFGIAKRIQDLRPRQLTATAERYLTPSSASPEQVRNAASTVASDIYSLGALLYELLCGLTPFDLTGLSFGQIEKLLSEVPPKPPSMRVAGATEGVVRARSAASAEQLQQELKGDLDGIVLNCLRKEPALRYPSGAHLNDDIDRFLSGRPISLRRGERLYVAKRFVARHRLAVSLVSLLAASAAVFVVFISLLSVQLTEQRNYAIRERDAAQAVADLLKSSFLSADPARSAGAEVSARKILDAAKPRLDALVDSDPALFATLTATIAEVELGFENDSAASELAARALQSIDAASAAPAELRRRLHLLLANSLIGQGRFEEAESALLVVADFDVQPKLDWQVAQGRYLYYIDRLDDAIELLSRAVKSSETLNIEDAHRLEARWHLAGALFAADRLDQAAQVLQQASAELAATLGEADPRRLMTELRLVDLLTDSGKPVAAEQEARRLLPVLSKPYGADSTMAALVRDSLARALYSQSRLDEAIAEYEAGLQAWRASIGSTHPRTLRAALNLAQMYSVKPDRRQHANALYREALEGLHKLFGAQSNIVFFTRVQYARFLSSGTLYSDALGLLSDEAALAGLAIAGPSNRQAYFALLRSLQQALRCDPNQELATPPNQDCTLLERLRAQERAGTERIE